MFSLLVSLSLDGKMLAMVPGQNQVTASLDPSYRQGRVWPVPAYLVPAQSPKTPLNISFLICEMGMPEVWHTGDNGIRASSLPSLVCPCGAGTGLGCTLPLHAS